MTLLDLPTVTLRGDERAMGLSYGAQLREPIRAFVDERMRAARVYLRERGIRDEAAFLALGAQCLAQLAAWDPAGHAEAVATAEGAGVEAVALYTAGNMTDIRDILALPAQGAADAEGCTTALIPASHAKDGAVIAAQTWDLNPGDLQFVYAVNRNPTHGPRTWSVTVAGSPSLVGMNEHGVCVGTTNIKCRGSRVGIPYLSLLHRAVRCRTRAEASGIVERCPLAAAHTYWIADETGVEDWERTPQTAIRRADRPLSRSNHCLMDANRATEGEPATASSRARVARAQAFVDAGGVDEAAVRGLFADRSDGVDSINRYAEDGQGTSTNACLIMHPARRTIRACRGSADRGAWINLGF